MPQGKATKLKAYRGVTATDKFRYLEILRERTRHDEAQAIGNAKRQEAAKWQRVVADKDARIAELEAMLGQL